MTPEQIKTMETLKTEFDKFLKECLDRINFCYDEIRGYEVLSSSDEITIMTTEIRYGDAEFTDFTLPISAFENVDTFAVAYREMRKKEEDEKQAKKEAEEKRIADEKKKWEEGAEERERVTFERLLKKYGR